MKIYATWIGGTTYAVTYDKGEGSGTVPTDPYAYSENAQAKVLDNSTLTAPDGKVFVGWLSSVDGKVYYPGSLITITTQNVILTAQWAKTAATTELKYDYNGGTKGSETSSTVTTLLENGQIEIMSGTDIIRPGYKFEGWNTKKDGTGTDIKIGSIQVDNLQQYTADTNILYAKWTELQVTITYESENLTKGTVSRSSDTVNAATGSLTETCSIATPDNSYYFTGWTLKDSTDVVSTNMALSADVVNSKAKSDGVYITTTFVAHFASKIILTNSGQTASKTYTGSEQEITDFTTTGLLKGDELSGLSYSARGTNVGTYPGAFSGGAVIKDENGKDVTRKYIITNTPGTLTITKASLALTNTGASDSKVYTGSEQKITDFTTTGLVGGAVLSGVTYSAKGTNVGTYTGAFSGTPVIKVGDVDVTENYVVTNTPGTLTITKASLALTNTGASDSKVYTGSEQEITDFTTTGLVGGAVLSGVTYSAKGTNVGTYTGAFSGTPVIKVGDVDVTENYVVTNTPGTLTITKASLALTNTGASDSKVYTGSEQEITDFTTTGLVGGAVLSGVTYSARGTNVGTYTGAFSGTPVIKVGDVDVTENYAITNTPGTLTITKASLALTNTASAATRKYTGIEQEVTDFTTTGLVGGAVLSGVTYSAKGTNVGTYPGAFSGTPVIKVGDVDVTENYAITNTPGTLTITKADFNLTNKGASDSKVYTGSEQEITDFTTVGLLKGHTLSGISYSAKGTNVGTYAGVFRGTAKVTDKNGQDVTENYAITNTPGTLTITKASLALTNTGASDSKVYTGSEQEITDFTTTGLVGGAVLSGVTYSAKGTNVGTYTGAFSGTPVIKVGDVDVTENYVVTNTPGTLTITKASLALTNTGASDSKVYTGSEQEITDFTTTGLVGGAVLSGVTYSAKGTNVGTYTGAFSGTPVIKVGDVDVTENYVVTNTPGTLTITKASLALTNTGASDSKVYTGSEQEITDFTTTGLVGGAVLSGVTYSAKGTNVGTYTGAFSGTPVIKVGDVDVTENYVVTNTPGTLTITKASLALTNTGASDSKVYTGSEQEITDFTTTGLVGGAVLSGVTYSAKGTNVGTYTGAFSGTPVIKVGDVDVTENYVVTNTPGTLTITKASLALTNTGASDSKVYTGSEQEITDFTTTGLVGGAVLSGVTYSAKGTNVGTYTGAFSGTPVIKVGDVDVTENYAITNTPGTLTITKASLALTNTASAATRKYTGIEQEVTDFTTTGLVGGAVLSGVTYSAKGTNVGTYPGAFSGTPVIKVGDVDVTENYVVTNTLGTLTITKADFNLTNKGASDSKVYTGSEQEITDFTTTGLVGGAVLSGVTYSAKGTNVGTYTGAFSGTPVIKVGDVDVTENYAITNTPGTLTITKASLALTNTGASDSKVYTGSEQEITDFTTTGLVGGAVLSGVTYSAKGTNVGTYTGAFSGTPVIKVGDVDVTENYVVTNTPGTLTITKASLALTNTGASDSKVYTGSEQEITDFTTTGLVGGAVLSGVTYSAKGTNVGTYTGAFSGTPVIKVGDVDVTENYAITNTPGTLTITKASLALTNTGASDSKVYTGSEQEITDFTTTGLVGGAVLSGVTYSARGTNVGTYTGAFSGTPVIKVGDVDVTENYAITNTPGTLTITKASLALTNTGASDSKVYTGSEQEITDFTTTGLVGGAVLSGVTYSAKGTNVGTYTGAFSGTPVIKVGDVDVTENYAITNTPGTLTITKASLALTNTGASDSKVYTGSEQEITDFTTTGLVGGAVLSGVTYSARGTNVGTYTGAFSGTPVIKVGDVDVTENYVVTNTPGTLTITKASLALTNTASAVTRKYTGIEQEVTDFTTTGLVGGAVLSGVTYSAKGTNVGTYTGAFSGTPVIKVGDVDVTENYEVTNMPGTLTITRAEFNLTNTGASDSKVYTGIEQEITDFTTVGLLKGHTLSGISYSAKGTNVGTYVGVFSGTAKVTDKNGQDVTENYAITNTPGTLTITKASLALTNTGASDSKVYTGSEQEITDFTTTGLVGGAVLSGVTYSAKGTNVGTYTGAFSGTPVIKVGDVDVTENYEVTNTPGTLTITKASLALTNTGASDSKVYTGIEQEITDFTTTGLVGGAVLSGVTYSARGTNVGTYTGAFSGTPVIKVGDVDVTENYAITNTPGTLTITKASLALTNTGASDSKVYTGSEQEITDFTTTGLVGGAVLSGVTYSARGTNVGTYTGAFSGTPVIKVGDVDVTENYAITNTPGTLTITKAPASENALTVIPYKEMYDGVAHTINANAAKADSTLYYSKDNTIWTDEAPTWTDVTEEQFVYVKATNINYEDVYGHATVTITPRQLTITTPSASKTYDGIALSAVGSISGLVNDETVAFNTTGVQLNVGSSTNTYTLAWTGTAKQSNYTVTESLGTLTVTEAGGGDDNNGGGGGDTTDTVITPVTTPTNVGQVLGATRLPDVPAPVQETKVGSVLGAIRNVVQTGDDSMMVMWGTMFAAAVAVLAAWLKKRHQGSEN